MKDATDAKSPDMQQFTSGILSPLAFKVFWVKSSGTMASILAYRGTVSKLGFSKFSYI